MTYEALTVYLTDVERLFNDKLLVPIHDDQKQLGKITPNNLLLLRKPNKFTRKLFSSMATSAVVTDYILALVDQSICYSYKHEQSGHKKVRDLQTGNSALVIVDTCTRNNWLKEVVVSVGQREIALIGK